MLKLWRRLMWRMYFRKDGEPIRCTKCGCDAIVDKVTDTLDYRVMEFALSCANCNADLGYWALGSFDPAYRMGYLLQERN